MPKNTPHLFYYNPLLIQQSSETLQVDLCIYGANAAGIIAALQASRMGLSAVLLEPGNNIGGMTSSGLSYTDTEEPDAIGGLSREFYRRCGNHYGVEEEWKFEPHVAEKVLLEMLEESGVPIYFRQYLQHVRMSDQRITDIRLEGGLAVHSRTFIDCSYEGDLMAKAGISYHVGRESNRTYGELYNGFQILNGHQFTLPVDPYLVEGDSSSGLLPGIEINETSKVGDGDNRIQAYNFRLCLTNNPDNQLPFEKPLGYDEREYELAVRYLRAGYDRPIVQTSAQIRNAKIDMNNIGAISSDFIGRNYAYPEADYALREKIFQEHVTYQKGLMWFWLNDPRVPKKNRAYIEEWGLPADEFIRTNGWPHQLYVREARRMVSDYVMTEHHCLGGAHVDDSIGMASYTMDSHNTSRIVRNGKVVNEGNVEIEARSFGISLRSIQPKRNECENLLVPVCLSSSHIAYGSIRMEPVFMILGQSAVINAALAMDSNRAVQDIPYAELREELQKQGQVLQLDHQAALQAV